MAHDTTASTIGRFLEQGTDVSLKSFSKTACAGTRRNYFVMLIWSGCPRLLTIRIGKDRLYHSSKRDASHTFRCALYFFVTLFQRYKKHNT